MPSLAKAKEEVALAGAAGSVAVSLVLESAVFAMEEELLLPFLLCPEAFL